MLLPRKTLYRNLGVRLSHENIILQLTPFRLRIFFKESQDFAEASSMYNIKLSPSDLLANSVASFTSGKHYTGLHSPPMHRDGQQQQAT